jgi:ATP-dependent Clp protease protease subunit
MKLMQLLASNKGNALRRFDIIAKGEEAEIFLYDAIVSDEAEAEWFGGVAAAPFVKALRGIEAKTINLRINSPGGSVFAARAMEQALRDHPARVVAHIDGVAASAATFIAMAADEVVMAKGALFMIHKAWGVAMGNSDDLMETAGLLEKIDGTLVDTYAERTKQKPEQIAEWLAAETWFSADEAVAHGFADRVADTKAKNAWNLSAYAKAPPPEPAEPEPKEPAAAGFFMSTANANRLRLLLA